VCQSWINAARQFGFNLRVAAPIGYEPDPDIVAASKDYATLSDQPEDAVLGADLVVTDTWTSIGMESERADRESIFSNYRVTSELMHQASKDALFMHCLPAYRGKEVDAKVIDGPQSVVWDEAENRLHAQKALMFMLLAG
jgi:ornithine carbamoyltransferase